MTGAQAMVVTLYEKGLMMVLHICDLAPYPLPLLVLASTSLSCQLGTYRRHGIAQRQHEVVYNYMTKDETLL